MCIYIYDIKSHNALTSDNIFFVPIYRICVFHDDNDNNIYLPVQVHLYFKHRSDLDPI